MFADSYEAAYCSHRKEELTWYSFVQLPIVLLRPNQLLMGALITLNFALLPDSFSWTDQLPR